MAKEMTVTQMVDAIAKLRGKKREETHDYMIKVAFGRLGALAAWRKAHPAKPSKKKAVKKASKKIAKKAIKKTAKKASAPRKPKALPASAAPISAVA